jgi:hypothetical protein
LNSTFDPSNSSVVGRLLGELSYSGAKIRDYRSGGRGFENVLTAEAFQGIDFLPRKAFLGAILARAIGASVARERLISEVEEATLTLLPGDQYLIPGEGSNKPKLAVQPDALIQSPGTYVVVEAKRIRPSSFQPMQLAREYVLTLRDSAERLPILLLVLGTDPPVKVSRHGLHSIKSAIELHIDSVLSRATQHSIGIEDAMSKIDDVVCWITWQQISKTIETQLAVEQFWDPSVHASVTRLVNSVTRAITWHGFSKAH